ncbi:D-alanyl-lipoteichoic acid biosynthesis protein DltD [Streptococcus didelphis]|uniref:D-alanyl-lipoteichoic acid biosynthesis protein DltD n=1 Tax=Streptococcus didelphis TaxID=102886 RepID=UPI000370C8CE|nr:D-alanyl-lipoteichoic acid biosynthesis protein DltD [Streptococcus didelphis]
MLKKLWLIFGPVLLALGLVIITIFSFPSHLKHDIKEEKVNAVSLTDTSFKNGLIKKQAFSDKNILFVPFFGSSEWSRMDSMHPSVLAEKYDRSYRPFLIGKRGTQSLSQYFGLQQFNQDISGKKAIFVISPQWFTQKGTEATAVQKYLSNSQIIAFLLQANNKDAEYEYAAKRLLSVNPSVVLSSYLRKVSQGKALSAFDKKVLYFLEKVSLREESLFSHFNKSDNYQTRIIPRTQGLPKNFSYSRLHELASRRGKEGTSNNKFGIQNFFFSKRIAPQFQLYKNLQMKYSYVVSPEYNDFQLLLSQFEQKNVQVLFVIPPVNKKWANYTGLNQKKYQQAVKKIKYQLESQGFTNIVDFSERGGDPYFMQDTIHIGWNGWLEFDKKVQLFLEGNDQVDHYDLDPYFYTKGWALARDGF